MSNELTAPSQRSRAALVRLVAVAVALLLISLLVVGNSRAAFTDTAEATGTWSAGEVKLTETADGVLFSADGLMPGDVVSEEVTVTYEGTADAVDVRLYGDGLVDDGLAAHLELTVEVDDTEVFRGTLAAFDATDFDAAADEWNDVPANGTREYDVTVTLDEETPNEAQLASASVSLVWEARSN